MISACPNDGTGFTEKKCEKLFRCRKREIPLMHMTGDQTSCGSHCSSSGFQAVCNAAAGLTVLSHRGMNA